MADNVNPDGQRLTTFEVVFNRWILAELNTHRVLSRNSASSRAIPIKRLLRSVWKDPAYPVSFGSNRAGMQAGAELTGWRRWGAVHIFKWARLPTLMVVWLLSKIGLHKQVANRLLEPWMWHTAIISGTDWSNFWKLRDHKDAQPEFQVLAKEMRSAMLLSTPRQVGWGGWHLPYIPNVAMGGETYGMDDPFLEYPKVSAACCARVSYVRQNDRKSAEEDIAMADKLTTSGHYSPLEHPAQAVKGCTDSNFKGWKQLRKFYPGEDGNG